jgi:hypothetical protein
MQQITVPQPSPSGNSTVRVGIPRLMFPDFAEELELGRYGIAIAAENFVAQAPERCTGSRVLREPR